MILELFTVLAIASPIAAEPGGADSTSGDSVSVGTPAPAASDSIAMPVMPFRLASTSFAADGAIPAKYTCEGGDVAPALTWSGTPVGTKSFALIVDDPDAPDPAAPKMVWVHWVAYNLPAEVSAITEGTKAGGLPKGALDGVSDFKKAGYMGPCPPTGKHRYYFKLYALDAVLPDLKRPTKAQLVDAMKGHVLAQAELIATYQKKAVTKGVTKKK